MGDLPYAVGQLRPPDGAFIVLIAPPCMGNSVEARLQRYLASYDEAKKQVPVSFAVSSQQVGSRITRRTDLLERLKARLAAGRSKRQTSLCFNGSTYVYTGTISQFVTTCGSTSGTSGIYNPYSTGTTYPYNTGTYNPYSTGTTYPYYTGSTYPYNTGISTYPYYNTGTSSAVPVSVQCPQTGYPYYSTGTTATCTGTIYNSGSTYNPYSPYSSSYYPYTTGLIIDPLTGLPYTSTVATVTVTPILPVFSQTSYALTQTGCTNTVGTVSATNNSIYSIGFGSNNFSIGSGGVITATTGLAAGTYSLTVISTSSTGTQTSVPVSVVISCATTGR
ncbi:hypothetical protein BV898_04242 [Hypsibius exemplaris]|uniref:Uncharacterized protein n=1 Tax=Hypsibius exemplaris TaxID=2072580 RepID=A0A1W0X2C1_HYPEX|nr:hypothetical protein BV898_04242 [Hypsibius exemplaris]